MQVTNIFCSLEGGNESIYTTYLSIVMQCRWTIDKQGIVNREHRILNTKKEMTKSETPNPRFPIPVIGNLIGGISLFSSAF